MTVIVDTLSEHLIPINMWPKKMGGAQAMQIY